MILLPRRYVLAHEGLPETHSAVLHQTGWPWPSSVSGAASPHGRCNMRWHHVHLWLPSALTGSSQPGQLSLPSCSVCCCVAASAAMLSLADRPDWVATMLAAGLAERALLLAWWALRQLFSRVLTFAGGTQVGPMDAFRLFSCCALTASNCLLTQCLHVCGRGGGGWGGGPCRPPPGCRRGRHWCRLRTALFSSGPSPTVWIAQPSWRV